MINSILTGIFKLILTLFDKLTSPLINGIVALFPVAGSYFANISNFTDYMLTNVPMILWLFLIPRTAMVAFFDYLLIKYSIYLLIVSFRFILNIYNKFKP